MADRKIEVVISAVDDYTSALNKFNTAVGQAGVQVEKNSQRMQKSWTETAIKVGAVTMAVKQFYHYTEEASAVNKDLAMVMERYNRALDIGQAVLGKAFVSLTAYTSGAVLFAASGFTELLRSVTVFISRITSLGAHLPLVGEQFRGLTDWLKHTGAGLDGVSSEFMDMSMAAFETGNTMIRSIGSTADEVDRLRAKLKGAAADLAEFKARIGEISTGPDAGSFSALYGSTSLSTGGDLNFSMDRFQSAPRTENEDQLTALEKLNNLKSPYGGYTPTDQFSSAYNEYDTKLKELETYNATKLQLLQEAGASELAIEAELAAMSNEYAAARRDFQLNAASQTLGGMSNFMQNLYVATGSRNKAMFQMMKAFAISEAVINTAKAATKALDAPPGPPISFAYVAATVAAGAAQIATIASSEPGSRQTLSATGHASPGYAGGSPTAYPVPSRLEEAKPAQQITLQVYALDPSSVNWDRMMEDNIKPALERLSTDRNVELAIKVAPR